MVTWPETEDGPGEPENAQLGDLKAPRPGLEAVERAGQEALHRRGQASPDNSHERPPRLQVSAPSQVKASAPQRPPSRWREWECGEEDPTATTPPSATTHSPATSAATTSNAAPAAAPAVSPTAGDECRGAECGGSGCRFRRAEGTGELRHFDSRGENMTENLNPGDYRSEVGSSCKML